MTQSRRLHSFTECHFIWLASGCIVMPSASIRGVVRRDRGGGFYRRFIIILWNVEYYSSQVSGVPQFVTSSLTFFRTTPLTLSAVFFSKFFPAVVYEIYFRHWRTVLRRLLGRSLCCNRDRRKDQRRRRNPTTQYHKWTTQVSNQWRLHVVSKTQLCRLWR